jgi:GTP-binding protein
MTEVLRVYEKWNTRVSTGLLNKWLHEFSKIQRMPTDTQTGKKLKMRYLMQIKTRPPTFFLFVNNKRLMTDNYEQFIRNSISKEFSYIGVPIRILLRDNRTQYAKKRLTQVLSASARSVLNRIKMHKQKKKN